MYLISKSFVLLTGYSFFLKSCYFIYSLRITIIVLWSFALLPALLPCPLLNLHHGTDNSVYSSSMAWAKLTEENFYRNIPLNTFSSLLFNWRAIIWWICYSSNSKTKKKIKTNNSKIFLIFTASTITSVWICGASIYISEHSHTQELVLDQLRPIRHFPLRILRQIQMQHVCTKLISNQFSTSTPSSIFFSQSLRFEPQELPISHPCL